MQQQIKNALNTLKAGGVILYPTDTIWGLGCDAANEEAVEKIYKIKQREDNKKMLVLANDVAMVERYISEFPDVAYDLIDLADKPLTVIFSGAKNLAKNLLGDNNSIGIRVTKEAFSNTLVQQFRRPIVSTSANIHGEPFPANFCDISEEILNAVDYVVDWRQDEISDNVPSSIIQLGAGGEVKIIRS